MPISINKKSNNLVLATSNIAQISENWKTEGTSQTFGQYIVPVDETYPSDTSESQKGGKAYSGDMFVISAEEGDSGNDQESISEGDVEGIILDKPKIGNYVDSSNISGEKIAGIVVPSNINTAKEIDESLKDAQDIDFLVTLSSEISDSLEYNAIKATELNLEYVYQHYQASEQDVSVQEDPKKDPFLNNPLKKVPRYVELRWEPVFLTEPLEIEKPLTKEEKDNKINILTRNTGNPVEVDGVSQTIIDIQERKTAFSAIANRTEFVNSISLMLNVNDEDDEASFLNSLQEV